MSVIINGDTGITTPAETVQGALTTTGNTILGDASTDTLNVGNGGLVKDASGNVGIGTSSPSQRLHVSAGAIQLDSDRDIQWGASEAAIRSTSSNLRFSISSTERMRIDSSGKVLINTTSPIAADGAFLNSAMGGSGLAFAFSTSQTGTTQLGRFYSNTSTNVGNISVTASATAYNTSSDYRLKNTIAPMTGALAKVALLKPCTYKWNADGSDGQGFIAHELNEVVSGCVTGEKDAVETYTDEEGNEATRPAYQGIDTSFLVATLTAAIQEQQTLIAQLQADVATLKALSA